MSAGAQAHFARLQAQRSAIVQGFLWILLGILGATFALNAVLLGPDFLTLAALAPNLLFLATLAAALWFNSRHAFRLAVGLVVGITLVAAVIPVLIMGVAGNALALFMFFVPMVLAGLLLNRVALYLTASVTILVVLLTPAVRGVALAPGGDPQQATPDAWLLALQFTLIYAIVAFFIDRFGSVLNDALRDLAEKDNAQREKEQALLLTQEVLVDTQGLNDVIIESLPGLFYVIDESGSYFRWNRNFVKGLGYSDQELGRLNPLDLFEGEEKELIARSIARVFTEGHASVEATVTAKDGRRVPYLLNGTRVTLGGRPYLAGIGVDRSEVDAANARANQLNTDLIERLERLRALRAIDLAITGSLELDPALDVVLTQVTERLHVDAASILLYHPEDQKLRFGASRGFRDSPFSATELRLGQGLAGRAARERQVMKVNDPGALARELVRYEAIKGEGFQSYLAIPLVSNGRLQGVLELFHHEPLRQDEDWSGFMTALATQAALALDNAAMFEDLQRSNDELRLAYDTTIEGWARALDLRDEETAGHSQRVTDLTLHLAKRMGIAEDELEHVRRGALLHDIGKMGVPDSILLKPGKLTEEEWVVMQQHTTFARDFLAPIPFLRPALDIPYAHHEKYDGSGYPLGLEGEAIPLAARIFAVIDVYDALTSDRPYRKAWSQERALQHIKAQAGTHFDPSIVSAFLGLMVPEDQDRVNVMAP